MNDINQTEEDLELKAVLTAQDKQNQAIAEKHIAILKHVQRLEKLGGQQDYTHTIVEGLKAFGGERNLSFFAPVIADQALFAEARKRLIENGLIIEVQDRNRKILKLVKAA